MLPLIKKINGQGMNGSTLTVAIPKDFAKELKLSKGQEVKVSFENEKIIIEKYENKGL